MSSNLLESGWHGFQKQPDWAKALISLGALAAVAAGGYYAAPALGLAAAGSAGAGAAGAGAGLAAGEAAGVGAGLGAGEAVIGGAEATAGGLGGEAAATGFGAEASGIGEAGMGAATPEQIAATAPFNAPASSPWYSQLMKQINPSIKTGGGQSLPRTPGGYAPPASTPSPMSRGGGGWAGAFGSPNFNPGAQAGQAASLSPHYKLMGRSAQDPRVALLQLLQGGGR